MYELYGYDGIMYALASNDPFTFIDLDKCRDPETKIVKEWALDIIKPLNGYCELSPSGTGIHLFVRAQLPPGRRRIGHIEMYDQNRFATMTGQRFILGAF